MKRKKIVKKSKRDAMQNNKNTGRFKVPKILTNIWIISAVIVLVLFIILPTILIHPKSITVYENLTKHTWNIPPGEYVYNITFSKKFIDKVVSAYSKDAAQRNMSMNRTELTNISNNGVATFWVSKKENITIIRMNNSRESVSLDVYGNEIGSNTSVALTKTEYNLIFMPWMAAVCSPHWSWKVSDYIDLGIERVPSGSIEMRVIGTTELENRSAYIVNIVDNDRDITYLVDQEYKIALSLHTDEYNATLVSAPFMK